MGLVALGRGRFGAAFVTASAERDDPTSVLYARLGP
jgi:hypothetical protein